MLGQTILSLGIYTSRIFANPYVVCYIESSLIYVVNVLVPSEIAIVVLTDETGCINVFAISPETIVVVCVCFIIQQFQECFDILGVFLPG